MDEHGSSTDERVAGILEAAADVFFERGFAGARVDEIARRAGVNKAMLYYHVGDKDALFDAVLRRNLARALARVRPAVAAADGSAAKLRALVDALAENARTEEHLLLIVRELTGGGEHLSDEILGELVKLAQATWEVLSEGAATGRFRPVHPLAVHLALVAAVMLLTISAPVRARLATQGLVPPDAPPFPADIGAFVSDLFLNGIEISPGGES